MNDVKKSSLQKVYEQNDAINKMADYYLYEDIPEVKRQNGYFDIYNEVLAYQKNRQSQRLHLSKTLVEDIVTGAVTETFTIALNNCQKAYVETGERKVFLQEFNAIIGVYISKGISEALGDEDKYRKNMIYNLTKRIEKIYGKATGFKAKNYTVSEAKLKEYFASFNIPEEEYIEELYEIYHEKHVENTDFDVSDEENTVAHAASSAMASNNTAEVAERAMLHITLLLDKVFDSDIGKTDLKYVKYVFTIEVIKSGVYNIEDLHQYMDIDFYDFGKEKDLKDEATLLSEYLSKQRETVRKNINKARKIMLEFAKRG